MSSPETPDSGSAPAPSASAPASEGRLLSRKPAYPGRTIQVFLERVALPGGRVTELEIVHHPGAACILPVLADGTVVLVRQWRHAGGGWLLEAPAGKLDAGEEPEACARRELLEETGLVAGKIVSLGSILMTPGFCDERIHLYLALQPTDGVAALEPDEILTLHRVPASEAVAMATDGRIEDAKTLALIARARLREMI